MCRLDQCVTGRCASTGFGCGASSFGGRFSCWRQLAEEITISSNAPWPAVGFTKLGLRTLSELSRSVTVAGDPAGAPDLVCASCTCAIVGTLYLFDAMFWKRLRSLAESTALRLSTGSSEITAASTVSL